MNPDTRSLVKLTTDNFEEMLNLYTTLMGPSSKARKEFIFDHARQYKMISEDLNEEMEDIE